MFYKFMGGVDEAALLDIFEKAVVGGSFKFGAAWAFNDPFEFKFNALPPSSRAASLESSIVRAAEPRAW